LIYKFEFGFEAFAIRFVTAVCGMYLTNGATLSMKSSARVDNDLDSATGSKLKHCCVIT